MKLYPTPIEITEDEGFKEHDLFNRQPFAKNLTNIIKNCEDELVIAIDAPWGAGKTTFVNMWRGMLKTDPYSFESIYFDAYKNDYLDDPFLALTGEVNELLSQKNPEKARDLRKQAISVCKVIGRAGLNIGIKALLGVTLDETSLENAGVGDEAIKITDDYLEERITKLESDRKIIEEFQVQLIDAAEAISGDQKLIFIIDELDRCKPSFALDLIEKIKHIFSTKNIAFVLVMNQEQICRVIESRYGIGINATLYLQKFIHLWAGLPPENQSSQSNGSIYLENCLELMGFAKNTQPRIYAIEFYTDLINHYSLTFRDIERSLTDFSILVNADLGRGYRLTVGAYLAIIKSRYPSVFKSLAEGKYDYKNLISDTEIQNLKTDYWEDKPEGHPLKCMLKASLITDQNELQRFAEETKLHDLPPFRYNNIIKSVCDILTAFTQPQP